MNTTRRDIRKAYAAIGYKVNFRTNSLAPHLCSQIIYLEDMSFRHAQGDLAGVELYNKHIEAFNLMNSYRGAFLTDTDQRVAR